MMNTCIIIYLDYFSEYIHLVIMNLLLKIKAIILLFKLLVFTIHIYYFTVNFYSMILLYLYIFINYCNY